MLPLPGEVLPVSDNTSLRGGNNQARGAMFRVTHRLFPVIVAIAACGGPSSKPAKPPPQPATRSAADLVPMCQQIFARKATCADDYLPLLLDLRVELNLPPGIGDEVKAKGRDTVLAISHTELAHDTEPAKVDALCTAAAENAKKAPPERVDQLLQQGGTCEATTGCKAFASCVVQIDRVFIASPRSSPEMK